MYKFVSIFPVFVTFGLFTFLGVYYLMVNILGKVIVQFYVYPLMFGDFESLLGIPNPWTNAF